MRVRLAQNIPSLLTSLNERHIAMSTLELYSGLESYVEQSFRGRTTNSNRRSFGETILDIVPSSARQIVFGMAFTRWTGARLRFLVTNVNRTWQLMYLEVARTRLLGMGERWKTDVESDLEREALIGLLREIGEVGGSMLDRVEEVLVEVGAEEMTAH